MYISSLIRHKKLMKLKIILLWPHMLCPVFYPHRPLDFSFLSIAWLCWGPTLQNNFSPTTSYVLQLALHKTYAQLKQSVLINSPNNREFFVHTCKQNLNTRPCLAEYNIMQKEKREKSQPQTSGRIQYYKL